MKWTDDDLLVVYGCAFIVLFCSVLVMVFGVNPNLKLLIHDTLDPTLVMYKLQLEVSTPLVLRTTFFTLPLMWIPIVIAFIKARKEVLPVLSLFCVAWIGFVLTIHVFLNGYFSLPDTSEWNMLPIPIVIFVSFLVFGYLANFYYKWAGAWA